MRLSNRLGQGIMLFTAPCGAACAVLNSAHYSASASTVHRIFMIGTPRRSRNGSAQLPSDGCR
jgi:hypothetical protein